MAHLHTYNFLYNIRKKQIFTSMSQAAPVKAWVRPCIREGPSRTDWGEDGSNVSRSATHVCSGVSVSPTERLPIVVSHYWEGSGVTDTG